MLATNRRPARITFADGTKQQTVDLYSAQGLELVSLLWAKLVAQFKLSYDIKWMGIPIIQFPEDVLMMQELIWRMKPDVIVECGVAHGGSLVFYASLLELLGKGRVVGVDVEIRPHNRKAIEAHPMFHRIELFEGSSVAPATVDFVRSKTQDAGVVLIVLDSNHSTAHVAKEIELYHPMVTPGSYLVVMDGAQAYMDDIPSGKAEWKKENPLLAIEDFVAGNKNFEVDPFFNRLKVTSNPKGFLRRCMP